VIIVKNILHRDVNCTQRFYNLLLHLYLHPILGKYFAQGYGLHTENLQFNLYLHLQVI